MDNDSTDYDRPLDGKYDTEYWETVAKLILEHFFPNRFADLSVEKECPDLQNRVVGVEVTSAVDKTSKELDSLYCRNYVYGNEKQKEKALRRIVELGGHVGKFFLSHPVIHRDLNSIYNAVGEKLKKLNKNYKLFSENVLFIFCEILIQERELKSIMSELLKQVDEYENSFDSVFLYCHGDNLYELELRKNKYTILKGDNNDMWRLVNEARDIIEKKYKEK